MADKAKQHFVPRMLLKRFSWDGINVNICNIRGEQELISVPYKPQCQKRYFYGADKRIENALSKVENFIDAEINKLVTGCLAPLMYPSGVCLNDHELRRSMLSYIYIQYTRTKKSKDLVDKALENNFNLFKVQKKEEILSKLIKKNDSDSWGLTRDDLNKFINSSTIKIDDPFDHIFREAHRHFEKNQHLKAMVLFNSSKIPFITSDNPVLNIVTFFPEHVPSFFMPVSPAHCLFFFDERYFNVKNIENVVFISDFNEIAYINMMQCENCDNNIYLPRLSSYLTLRDCLATYIHEGKFWCNIKAISLSKSYADNISIPIRGGHATRVKIINT